MSILLWRSACPTCGDQMAGAWLCPRCSRACGCQQTAGALRPTCRQHRPATLTLAESQRWLDQHRARLSGSRALGTHSVDSDWDYWLADRHMPTLVAWLEGSRSPWTSPIISAVTWVTNEGHQVEASSFFPRYRPAVPVCTCGRAMLRTARGNWHCGYCDTWRHARPAPPAKRA